MIGQETIDRVRRETKIVELVGETVKLQRRGRSFTGLCPFHKEKTPSFHVNAERGFYHCFGCHASGDAIKFVQETEGLDFVEAVRSLAERAGIDVVDNESDAERQQQAEARRRQQELYDLNDRAAEYFERMLREHPLSALARAELDRRGLTPSKPTDEMADALQAFRLGYAPYGWDGLVRFLKESGLSARAAETVGLVAPRKTGSGHYDRFRHRLMFAVIDVNGRVVAFSGRALPEPSAEELRQSEIEAMGAASEAPAKYVNSPESPIYRKREAVFGLYQSRQALRGGDPCLVVEGNFDVVSLHARGIRSVVAPLGTAFTVEQARQIRRFTTDVVLMFDGDSAGKRATNASREPCQQAELTAKVVSLPAGKDPDDFVRERGPEGIVHLLKHSRGILEYLIDLALSEELLHAGVEVRAKSVQFVTKLIAAEKEPTLRELAETFADGLVAARLKIHQDNADEVRTLKALTRALQARPVNARGPSMPASPYRARSPNRLDEVPKLILGAILDFPELIEDPAADLAAGVLENDWALAFAALRQHIQGGRLENPQDVLAKLSPPIHPFALARLAAPRHERLEDARTELVDNVKKLRSLELKREKSDVTEELEEMQRLGDSKQEDALLQQLFEKARARNREHA
jgi:DNA primase